MASILLVDDDQQLLEQVKAWLTYESHNVELCSDAACAARHLAERKFDLIVLDWNLPGQTGVDICREFRLLGGQTPILMLSARDSTDEKAMALDAGADDYLTKPFHPKELTARLAALLRRPAQLKPTVIAVGNLQLDTVACKAYANGQLLKLPPHEFSLLQLLMDSPTRVFSTAELLDKLWSAESEVSTSIVKVYVNRLRKTLTAAGASVQVQTARGAGYFLTTQEQPRDASMPNGE